MDNDTPHLQLPGQGEPPNDSQPEQPSEPLNPAADLIRQKISNIYGNEPDLAQETEVIKETKLEHHKLTKHQQIINELLTSGKNVTEIQTDWHDYYNRLPDDEKHLVWHEFYEARGRLPKQGAQDKAKVIENPPEPAPPQPTAHHKTRRRAKPAQSAAELKKSLLSQVEKQANTKLSRRQHLQSLLFGFGVGCLVLIILLFSFFNERFVAPFITPSRAVTNTPIISDSTVASSQNPKIIIPKINVEIPVVYDDTSTTEKDIQSSLENGVVHYADTPLPGEQGNAVIVGHSSNNIFNKGKYKFAFVLLSHMENGDTFMLEKNGVRYTYKVYDKRIVKPTEVGVLGAQDKAATATLITCDPPGTSINRLVVVGEQINPDPKANIASTRHSTIASTETQVIPGNAPSLWHRLTGWL